ncbi:MAG: addiction module toxin, HicA family [Deltaproteobacteria bacterium]|nr:addiction module toxin, HicA family [Deltaproteobacteria bacterium]
MNDTKLPVLKALELIRALEKLGFSCTRKSKGSHFRYKHLDGRITTIPVHKGKDISKGLLRKILRDVDISIEELKKLL